ncbi:hypothetical protein ACMFMF_007833 [Clarireedia jacksonii]
MHRTFATVLWLTAQCTADLVINPKSADTGLLSDSVPIVLDRLFNNKAFGLTPGEANFDGIHSGYPAQYIPPQDLILNGVSFLFPQYNATGYDNVLSEGQILKPPPGRYAAVHMLAAAEHTAIASGFINASYTGNRNTSDAIIVDPFWDWPYPFGGDLVFPYYLTNQSLDFNRSNIFHVSNWLDSTHNLLSIQLPNVTLGSNSGPGGSAQSTRLHIFAISLIPANASGLALDVQYARSTQKWFEGTNKTQIVEVTINNVGDEWLLANHSARVTVSASGLTTVKPGIINRLQPGDSAIIQVGVINTPGTAAGSSGEAVVQIEGKGIAVEHKFNATYGIATYEPTFESIYEHEPSPWYEDAKYGIFIHWGVYSVPGWGNVGKNESYAEWYWYDLNQGPGTSGGFYEYHMKTYGPNVTYDDFIQNFTAANYNPKDWVDLFADSGANYFVSVSKHHDGYAIFDLPEKVTKRTSVAQFPHRNLLQELFDAAKKYQPQIHRATYFSLPEWFSPAYKPYGFAAWPGGNATNPFTNETLPYTGFVEVDDYVADVILPEMQTLADMGTEIMWCDIGGPNLTAEFAASYFNTAAQQGRQVLLNNRCGLPGDFDTPEYARYSAIPVRKWESNLGMDPYSYGYNRATPDSAYLSPLGIIQSLVDIVSKGGNFLLDIGPRADGTIIAVEQNNLRVAGKWIKSHGEAIFGSRYWHTPQEGEAIRYTQKANAFYIFSLYPPNGTLVLDTPIPYIQGDQITVLGGNMTGTVVASQKADNGSLVITVPDDVKNADEYTWVFKIPYNGEENTNGTAGGSTILVSNGA